MTLRERSGWPEHPRLPATLPSRWTSRREEEGRGDVISPFPTRVAGRWSWPLSPSHLLNNPSGLKQVSVE